jgi:hypothetical protein
MTIRILTATVIAAAIAIPTLIQAQARTADKPFVSGGKVRIELDGGEYEVRANADNHVRVTLTGNIGNATVAVNIAGTQADVRVKNTPHSNFRCVIEVPKVSDIVVRLSGGVLDIQEITGNKDVEATAGDLKIAAGSPDNYARVDASVKIGDLSAGPFGAKKGGFLSQSLNWSGRGQYSLHATLGAGDLKLR